MPPGRRQRRAFSNVPWVPSASIGHVRAAAGEPLDLGDDVDLGEVEGDVGAHAPGHLEADRVTVDADDERGAHQLRAGGGAQADRALGEDDDRVADLDAARFGAAEAGRRDVGQQDDLLVGHVIRDGCEVRLRRRDEEVLGLGAVDRVAEAPATKGLVAVAVAALAEVAGQAGAALAAGRDRADEDALADLVAGDADAELLDDADRLVADDQPGADRVLALDDVDVGAADGRRRDADHGLAGRGVGRGTSSTRMSFGPWNTVARMVSVPRVPGRSGSATRVMAGLQRDGGTRLVPVHACLWAHSGGTLRSSTGP